MEGNGPEVAMKKTKPYCLKGHGKENSHLNRAIREALPSGADAI